MEWTINDDIKSIIRCSLNETGKEWAPKEMLIHGFYKSNLINISSESVQITLFLTLINY